ncbi:MAG: cold shock domain-containing protein, partial [Thermodesulfobacteriota bacterium]|nr:cold shock domain-containing protein [Thermodesulfobacteriota bacterium]
ALIELGDRDQAIKTLEKSNSLYKKEHGKDFNKILEKIDEIKEMNQGDNIVLEEPISTVSTISHGIVAKYRVDKGFGFIKDDNDGQDVFFHITRVKNRETPVEGNTVKFLREIGKKGLEASKVWIQDSS